MMDSWWEYLCVDLSYTGEWLGGSESSELEPSHLANSVEKLSLSRYAVKALQ